MVEHGGRTASTVCMPASLSLFTSVAFTPACSRQFTRRGPCCKAHVEPSHREANAREHPCDRLGRRSHLHIASLSQTYKLVRLGAVLRVIVRFFLVLAT